MWPYPQEIADLVTFTEEILNGKLHFLCSASFKILLVWIFIEIETPLNSGTKLGQKDGTGLIMFLEIFFG